VEREGGDRKRRTLDVLDPSNEVSLRELAHELVAPSRTDARDLGDERGGDDFVILGPHLGLAYPREQQGEGGSRNFSSTALSRGVRLDTYGSEDTELIRRQVSEIGGVELHGESEREWSGWKSVGESRRSEIVVSFKGYVPCSLLTRAN
jgi:hypothetical protein